jgi:ubiquinone/menaquinone biosynthesis C-methylase UbiE
MKLNLGCGSQVVDGWVNVDYALGARLMRVPLFSMLNRRIRLFSMDWDSRIFIHDLRERFPWEGSSVDKIYSSHTLEHLSKEDGRNFLRECFRVLRPGGVLRIVVPDLEAFVSKYAKREMDADDFLIKLDVLSDRSGGFFKKLMSPYISYPHQCMYDTRRLVEIMHETGFEAEPKKPFESGIEDIHVVEREDRTVDAVVVEGVKP